MACSFVSRAISMSLFPIRRSPHMGATMTGAGRPGDIGPRNRVGVSSAPRGLDPHGAGVVFRDLRGEIEGDAGEGVRRRVGSRHGRHYDLVARRREPATTT